VERRPLPSVKLTGAPLTAGAPEVANVR